MCGSGSELSSGEPPKPNPIGDDLICMDYARYKRKKSLGGNPPLSSKSQENRTSVPVRGSDEDIISKSKITIAALSVILFLTLALTARYYWGEWRWRYIIVHHTASDFGNLDYYRKIHMEERGWPDIAYHFLINNGSSNTSVGQVETSKLWEERSHHYSTQVSWINYFGIAVVLVGNFDAHDIPPLQRESLINLLARLAKKYEIPVNRIVGHREVWNTKCPGKHLNMIEVRKDVARILATNHRN